MTTKKTVVLCGIEGEQKAILNLEQNLSNCNGTIRLFNVAKPPEGILSVGLLCGKEVFKAVANQKEEFRYDFFMEVDVPLEKFTVALILTNMGKSKPLFVGSCGGAVDKSIQTRLASAAQTLGDSPLCACNVKKALDDNKIDFDDSIKDEIERGIDEELKKNKQEMPCKTCKYKEAFYEHQMHDGPAKPEKSVPTFYSTIMPQIDQLFEKYEPELELSKIVANSKWVKVDFACDGNYYVIGLVFENDNIKYVCYGLPGVFSSSPPKEFDGLCKWLPLSSDRPFESGYWMIYQNAETGDNENVEVV